MIDLILISPPKSPLFTQILSSKSLENSFYCEENLGIASISAFLEIRGINVSIFDVDSCNQSLSDFLDECKITFSTVIGISVKQSNFSAAITITEQIRNILPNNKIIIGGIFPSILKKKVFKYCDVDAVIVGTAEKALFKLLHTNYKDWHTIPQVITIIGDNSSSQMFFDINEFPMPNHYLAKRSQIIGIYSSKGCSWNKCKFCSLTKINNKKWQGKQPENIIKEIRFLYENFGINKFSFVDEDFIGPLTDKNKERAKQIAKGIYEIDKNNSFLRGLYSLLE